MKTAIAFFVTLCLTAGAAVASAQQQVHVSVDGVPVQFADVNPMLVNDRVMVPLRGAFEQMGVKVRWDESTRSVTASDAHREIVLRAGDRYAMVNGQSVLLDSPPIMVQDRVLVPLRFISETLGARVKWSASDQAVAIFMPIVASQPVYTPTMATIGAVPVIPLSLNERLTSNGSNAGDRFTARVNTGSNADYLGLPAGTIVEGHVDAARPKSDNAPGVLSLAFDRVRAPNGQACAIDGYLIGTDANSVDNVNGRMVAKPSSSSSKNLKFVGYGAGAGALLSVVTKGNLITDSVIGAALGYLYGSSQKDTANYNNVVLEAGAGFGVSLNRDLSVPVAR